MACPLGDRNESRARNNFFMASLAFQVNFCPSCPTVLFGFEERLEVGSVEASVLIGFQLVEGAGTCCWVAELPEGAIAAAAAGAGLGLL